MSQSFVKTGTGFTAGIDRARVGREERWLRYRLGKLRMEQVKTLLVEQTEVWNRYIRGVYCVPSSWARIHNAS